MKNNNRHRNLRIIAIALIGLILSTTIFSCKSSSSRNTIDAPAFTATRPTRPSLVIVDDGVQIPATVVINQELLIGYALKLELYADAWEQFYKDITAIDKEGQ